MIRRFRVIDSGACDPFTNMALDETLMRSYAQNLSSPTFRVYRWAPASLSLGCSQDPERELDTDRCRRRSMPFVRRITGGGIIMHDDEITYSLVCSMEDLDIPDNVASSYKSICAFLINFYRRLGLDAAFACEKMDRKGLGDVSALCFAAKEKYDIVIDGKKIGGNAQKRSRGVIFQHGSLPISCDPDRGGSFLNDKTLSALALGASALEDLVFRVPDRSELSRLLIDSFKSTFSVEMAPAGLSNFEERLLEELREKKYKSRDWNYHRIDHTAQEGPSPALAPAFE